MKEVVILHILKKVQNHLPYNFAYKDVSADDNISKSVFLYRGENAVYKFIEAFLEEYNYCKKVMKKHFDKNLIMAVDDEKRFQSSNKCWICNKLFTDEDIKSKRS